MMKPIEIDFDVNKKIELARTSFEETPNDVLRRLLGLPAQGPQTHQNNFQAIPTGRPWSGKGVELPHGTELRMDYNGKVYQGLVQDGSWVVEGTQSLSPSDAAGSVATTKDGGRPSLNGWNYWQVKRPTDRTWKQLSSLRK